MQKFWRRFRRQYHIVKKLYFKLLKSGESTFHLSYKNNVLNAEHKLSNPELATRFYVLMRPFLDSNSSIYYIKIWRSLESEFSVDISDIVGDDFNELIRELKEGYISTIVNNKLLFLEDIYNIISEGHYFTRKFDFESAFAELQSPPYISPFFWYQFHHYNLLGFSVISIFFNIYMSHRSENEVLRSQDAICIYCLTTTGKFTSEEHILPESLGNDEIILPVGFVCDRCNNGILSTLDESLIEFPPIALLRVQYVTNTKKGKLPQADFDNMKIEKRSPLHIHITPKDETGFIEVKEDLGEGWFLWNFTIKSKTFDPVKLARSIYKIALGCLALGKGQEYVCSSKFDNARRFINEGEFFPNNMIMIMNIEPHPRCSVRYEENIGSVFCVDIFGVVFILCLEAQPYLTINEKFEEMGLISFSLSKKGEFDGSELA